MVPLPVGESSNLSYEITLGYNGVPRRHGQFLLLLCALSKLELSSFLKETGGGAMLERSEAGVEAGGEVGGEVGGEGGEKGGEEGGVGALTWERYFKDTVSARVSVGRTLRLACARELKRRGLPPSPVIVGAGGAGSTGGGEGAEGAEGGSSVLGRAADEAVNDEETKEGVGGGDTNGEEPESLRSYRGQLPQYLIAAERAVLDRAVAWDGGQKTE